MLKTKMNKLMFGFSLALFLLCINISYVYAKDKITSTLNLTDHETANNLEDEGWSWNKETQTLILENVNIETSNLDPCIELPGGNVTIEFEGNNTLKAQKGTVLLSNNKTNLTIQSSNSGVLNLEISEPETNTNDTNGLANIGATILTAYNLDIKSGTINSRGNFLADGIVTISGGNVNINIEDMTYGSSDIAVEGIYSLRQVNITGGNVDIKAKSAAIVVDGVTGETDYPDGVIISGGNVSLITQSPSLPAVYVGNMQTKNIIINGGDITLGGGYGLYTADGVIIINRFDSLNTDKVINEVFRVSTANENNKIIYADADYSKVDDAITRANSLDKTNYKNFNLVEEAIAAVVRGKNVLEQSEVDAMALNINNAIANLISNEAQPQEPDNTDNPNTYDGILKYIIYLTLSAVSIGSSLFLYKKESVNY